MTENQKWEWLMSRSTPIETTPEPESKLTGIIAVCLLSVCVVMCLVHAVVVGV
jgi:hypothetical protein